jgi:recombination protein RecT
MTETVSTAVANRDNGAEAMITTYKDDFATLLPSHVKTAQFVSLAIYALRRNKDLVRAANANPGSFIAALLDCARLGLQPGDTFHLVPFGNDIVGIVDWTGEIELIYNAGAVSSVVAEIVREKDDFEYVPGVNERPVHKADWFGERGKMIGVYAYAVLKDGATSKVVVMNEAEIDQIKAVSKTARSSSSPWQKWPDRMWRKSAVKQLAKWVPSDPEIRSRQQEAKATLSVVQDKHPEIPQPSHDLASDEPKVDDDGVLIGELVEDCDVCGELGEPGHDVEAHDRAGVAIPA